MKALPAGCVDLTIASPPWDDLRFYNGYSFDFAAVASQLFRMTKPGGVVVWIVHDQTRDGSETGTSFRQVLGFMEVGFNLHDTMICQQRSITHPSTNRYYSVFDFMFVFSKGTPKTANLIRDRRNLRAGKVARGTGPRRHERWITERYGVRTNVWKVSAGGHGKTAPDPYWQEHPASMPLQLAKDHVTTWSNEGDLVFDPMAGSGSSLIAAALLGRRFLGMEISPEYCDLIRRRLDFYKHTMGETV
jgi:site-specific DNA-methyltransferase (adenine-specific)